MIYVFYREPYVATSWKIRWQWRVYESYYEYCGREALEISTKWHDDTSGK